MAYMCCNSTGPYLLRQVIWVRDPYKLIIQNITNITEEVAHRFLDDYEHLNGRQIRIHLIKQISREVTHSKEVNYRNK